MPQAGLRLETLVRLSGVLGMSFSYAGSTLKVTPCWAQNYVPCTCIYWGGGGGDTYYSISVFLVVPRLDPLTCTVVGDYRVAANLGRG